MVLVCATMWWPLSARLAIAFLRNGCRVSAVCPPGHPLRFVTGIESLYLYRGLRSLGSLTAAILAAQPTLIVPCDDGVVWQLHQIHAENPELQSLIERSLGSKEHFQIIRSRAAFLQAAAELGICVPVTRTVASQADVKDWWADTPAVLKLDGTWGGSGVVIGRSLEETLLAFDRFSQPMGAGMAWKRWLINRDPIALWSWRRREASSVTIQEYVSGRPANAMIACWQGELLATVTVEVLTSQGATGAAIAVRLVKNDEIEQAARLLARVFKLSGFHGLDFIIEHKTGKANLIEINPRCTQLGHLRLPLQGDLAGTISAKLWDEPVPTPQQQDCIHGQTIAFFPQTFNWNPKSVYLRNGKHDVPWEEPELVRELFRDAWPERQWLSRIYHHFRVLKRPEEVNFERE
jgi:ATP-grasp domain